MGRPLLRTWIFHSKLLLIPGAHIALVLSSQAIKESLINNRWYKHRQKPLLVRVIQL